MKRERRENVSFIACKHGEAKTITHLCSIKWRWKFFSTQLIGMDDAPDAYSRMPTTCGWNEWCNHRIFFLLILLSSYENCHHREQLDRKLQCFADIRAEVHSICFPLKSIVTKIIFKVLVHTLFSKMIFIWVPGYICHIVHIHYTHETDNTLHISSLLNLQT